MSLARLAVKGEVLATPGMMMPPDDLDKSKVATLGIWKAGPVVETPRPAVTVDGLACLAEARCTFSFSGTMPDPKSAGATLPVVATSSVTLSPDASALKCGGDLLRDGATVQDSFGNTLKAVAEGTLRAG